MLISFLKKHWGLLLVLPFFLAFFFAPYYKGLNSDHAIHALMADYFLFKKNLYYWGQDRLGSLIPMVAAPFQNLGMSSIWAAACSQLLLVLATYYFFQKHFSKAIFKGSLALVLLLPVYPFLMQTMIGHPYLAQLFFTGAYLTLPISQKLAGRWQALLLPLLMAGAVWSSELALVGIIAFGIAYYKYWWPLLKKHYLFFMVGLALGVGFLYYAKITAYQQAVYQQKIASLPEIYQTLSYYSNQFWQVLTLDTNKIYNSVLVYVLMINFIALFSLFSIKKLLQNRVFTFALLTAIGTTAAVIISHWVVFMNYPYNYFIPAYFFLIIALISGWQSYIPKIGIVKRCWLILFPVSYIIAHIVACMWFINTQPLKVNGRIDKFQATTLVKQLEGESLKGIGLLGTYWNAYLIDAFSSQILGMPCEGYEVRSFQYYYEVFERPVVFLRNGCVPELSDTIYQHKQTLLKVSPVYRLDTLEYAYYKSIGNSL
jgi:hypothetical protein